MTVEIGIKIGVKIGVKMGHSKIGVSDDAEHQNVTNHYIHVDAEVRTSAVGLAIGLILGYKECLLSYMPRYMHAELPSC